MRSNGRAPGYQSWQWRQQDWRSVILRGSKIDYSKKCGASGTKLPDGRPRLCLPLYVLKTLNKTAEGRKIIRAQARKKEKAKKGQRVPWHPRIKELHRKVEKMVPEDRNNPASTAADCRFKYSAEGVGPAWVMLLHTADRGADASLRCCAYPRPVLTMDVHSLPREAGGMLQYFDPTTSKFGFWDCRDVHYLKSSDTRDLARDMEGEYADALQDYEETLRTFISERREPQSNPDSDMCLYSWMSTVMMTAPYSREGIGNKAEYDGFDPDAARVLFDRLEGTGQIAGVGRNQFMDSDIVALRSNPANGEKIEDLRAEIRRLRQWAEETPGAGTWFRRRIRALKKEIMRLEGRISNPSGLGYKAVVKGPIAMDTPDGPVVLYRNPREYPWLSLDLVDRSEPAMRREGVSKVARGAQKSTQTREGFMQAYRRTGGSKAKMRTRSTGHGDQTWAERRQGFIARHLKQMKSADGNPSGWTPSGEPTRRHLGLVAWAYSPTPGKLRKWLARKNPSCASHIDLADPEDVRIEGFPAATVRQIEPYVIEGLYLIRRYAQDPYLRFPSPIVPMSREEIAFGRTVRDAGHEGGAGHGQYNTVTCEVKINASMSPEELILNIVHENLHHAYPELGEVEIDQRTDLVLDALYGEG